MLILLHATAYIYIYIYIYNVNILDLSIPLDPIQQDFELIRVFDSLEFEDEVEECTSMGLQSSGSLNQQQTRQLMQYLGQCVCVCAESLG